MAICRKSMMPEEFCRTCSDHKKLTEFDRAVDAYEKEYQEQKKKYILRKSKPINLDVCIRRPS